MLSIGLTSFSTKFPFLWITRYSIVLSLSYFIHYSFVFTNMQRYLSSYLQLLVTFSSVADTIRNASVLSFVRCSFVPFTGIAMACTHYSIKCNEEILLSFRWTVPPLLQIIYVKDISCLCLYYNRPFLFVNTFLQFSFYFSILLSLLQFYQIYCQFL